MGLLDKIKEDAKKSGQNKGKFFFVREGDKKRIRFLSDMEDGFEVVFHDSFEANINVPCQEIFGRNCMYCDEDGLRTRTQYAWSIWDYEANEVKLFMFPMNNCSPLGAIAAMYETYGTLLDRDYVISVQGKQQSKTYSVVPMDKNKFRNEKAKPLSKQKFLDVLDKAYPDEHSGKYGNVEEDDEPKPRKKKSKPVEDEEEKKLPFTDPDDDSWDDEAEEVDYSEMSAKELFKLCKERSIEAMPKKPEKYYINLLKEYDKAQDDWDDEDSDEEDDDDWE